MRKNIHKLGMLAVSAFVLSMGASSIARAEGAGQYISDAAITAKVKAALLADSQLKSTQVSVETTQGIVQLSGAVDSKAQESEAVNAANKVDGVKQVKDLLSVKGGTQEE